MLVLEVFSAEAPFAEIAENREVWRAIAAGTLPPNPDRCPRVVYDKLMMSCWAIDPSNRPDFTELHDLIVRLGGDSTDNDRSTEWDRLQRIHSRPYFESPEGQKFLGVSVHHLCTAFTQGVRSAVAPPYLRRDGATIAPSQAKVFDAVAAYVKPRTATLLCPSDGQPGCSYVSSLRSEHTKSVGPASALLSYSWGYEIKAITTTLAEWCTKNDRDLKSTCVWVCSLCLNQHRIVHTLSPAELAREFGERVERIGRIAPMLSTWKVRCSRVFGVCDRVVMIFVWGCVVDM